MSRFPIKFCPSCGGCLDYDAAVAPDGAVLWRCQGHGPEGETANQRTVREHPHGWLPRRLPALPAAVEAAVRQALVDVEIYGTGWVRIDRPEGDPLQIVTVNPLRVKVDE